MVNAQDVNKLAQELSDLELALLLCLSSHEHCLIETTEDSVDDVAAELALICSNTYGLAYTIIDFSETSPLEDFPSQLRSPGPHNAQPGNSNECQAIDVVIAKNLDHASDDIQTQALELMRSKKLISQSLILDAPQGFLFVPVLWRDAGQVLPKLNSHLNDHLIISYFHDSDGEYVYLEDSNDWLSEGQASLSSVVHKPDIHNQKYPKIDLDLLDKIYQVSRTVTVSAEIVRYQQDIVVFLRLSRAVAGGISARSNTHFTKLAKLLAVLHGIDYLTPSIVALAAKKVFRHRIVVAKPENDRSLQYGSDMKAVAQVLEYATPDTILESVLTLEAPL